VRNATGQFIKADLPGVTAAAAAPMPADFRVSITNAPGREAYPISSFTWLLIPSRIENRDKAQALKEFLRWMLADGQKLASALGYAPLSDEVVKQAGAAISQVE
jgi:phosphate transport system substrate-binding protein